MYRLVIDRLTDQLLHSINAVDESSMFADKDCTGSDAMPVSRFFFPPISRPKFASHLPGRSDHSVCVVTRWVCADILPLFAGSGLSYAFSGF